MNAIPTVRAAYAVSAAERDFEPAAERPFHAVSYGWVSETRLWPGCAFFRMYSDTGRVALRQPDWSLN